MNSVLSQLNFLKYSKEEFYNYKSEFEDDIILLDNIEQKLNLIRQKINKNAKSNIQNSFEKIDKKSKFAKSWRITATVIKKKDLSIIEQSCNEINSYLNKLSPQNFDKISDKVLVYLENENNTSEMLKELIFYTINNIFKKAVTQPVYCPYYVKLLNILDKKFQIRDLIDKKCAEFKNVTNKSSGVNADSADGNSANVDSADSNSANVDSADSNSANVDDNSVDSADSNSVDSNSVDSNSVDGNSADGNSADSNSVDGNSVDGNSVDSNRKINNKKPVNLEQIKYDEFCEEMKSKKFIEGYSQFIGELYKNNMIKYETLKISIIMFFDNLFEELDIDCNSDIVEYLIICLCKLYTTIKSNIKEENKKNFLEKFKQIKERDIIKRLKFKMMDIIEGR
jgi:hypothetical protein